MTYKHDFPLGGLAVDSDSNAVSFQAIRSAVDSGWSDVDYERIEKFIFEGVGSDTIEDYISNKRDEAILWLNANCVTDNVKFEYYQTIDDSGDEDEELFVFALSSTEGD